MNYTNIKLLLTLISIMFASVALANDHSSTKGKGEVDIDTPDEVLLEDVNFKKMAQVAKPSTRLSMNIEGVEHEIDVMVKNNYTVLMVPKSSKAAAEEILSAYKASMNTEAVEIKFIDAE